MPAEALLWDSNISASFASMSIDLKLQFYDVMFIKLLIQMLSDWLEKIINNILIIFCSWLI